MKRWVLAVATATYLAGCGAPTAPPTPPPQLVQLPPEGVRTWFKEKAVVYKGPSTNTGVLRRVKAEEPFTYIAISRGWAKEHDGVGWAQASDLTTTAPLTKAQKAQRAREEEHERRFQAQAKMIVRRQYEKELRERFLDQGLDIKVKVSGANADRITLTYVLANDVWAHRFSKDGIVDKLGEMGFRRVDLDDGYNYGHYWTFH